MRNNRWTTMLAGLLTSGLIAAGCGSDSTSTGTAESTTSPDTTATEDTASEQTSSTSTEEATTTDSTSSDTSGGTSPDQFYDACTNAAANTGAEAAAATLCGQARDALQQCEDLAQSGADQGAIDAAQKSCQDAADAAVKQLESAGG